MNSLSFVDDFAAEHSLLSSDHSELAKALTCYLSDHLKPGDKIIFSFLPTCQDNVPSCINQNIVLQRNFLMQVKQK